MWRTTVLAQGLHGCEIRNISHNQLRPFCVRGKVLVARKAPLDCLWSAIGYLRSSRFTLGSGCAAYALAAHACQSVATVHRQLTGSSDTAWDEPSPALASTLSEFGWMVLRNVVSMRPTRWPELDPEPEFFRLVTASLLRTRFGPDGSIKMKGGVPPYNVAARGSFFASCPRRIALRSVNLLPCLLGGTLSISAEFVLD